MYHEFRNLAVCFGGYGSMPELNYAKTRLNVYSGSRVCLSGNYFVFVLFLYYAFSQMCVRLHAASSIKPEEPLDIRVLPSNIKFKTFSPAESIGNCYLAYYRFISLLPSFCMWAARRHNWRKFNLINYTKNILLQYYCLIKSQRADQNTNLFLA